MGLKKFIFLLLYSLFCVSINYSYAADIVEIKNRHQIDSFSRLLISASTDTQRLSLNLSIAIGYQNIPNYDEVIKTCAHAVEIGSGKEADSIKVKLYNTLADAYYRKGSNDKALEYYLKAVEIAKTYNYNAFLSYSYNGIGVIYKGKGNYPKAIEYYQLIQKIQEQLGDSVQIGRALNNIGNVYFSFGLFPKAIDYYSQSVEIFKRLKKDNIVGYITLNIGISYSKAKDSKKALEYFRNSLTIMQKYGYKPGIAQVQSEMGTLYAESGNYSMALKYLEDALKVYKAIDEKLNIALVLRGIGETYNRSKNYTASLSYYKQSVELEKQMGMKKEMLDNYKDIAGVYYSMGEYKTAYQNFNTYSTLKDSILGEENLKNIQELEAKYDNAKKEAEIKEQKANLDKKDLEAKRQRIFLYAVALIALLVIAFTFVLYRQFAEKKKANILLAQQNDEIKAQRDQIFHQKKEITDSIHYASRIQRAVLPSSQYLKDFGLKYFILYKPRDIVSGDFYWINPQENKILIAAADCTGHGVPGAFMSMLGMAFLNEIVTKGEATNPADILFSLRQLIIKSLHQSGKQEETKDGMDIALVMIDKETSSAQFAGAFNSMYLIRNGELQEVNADRMPVGFHDKLGVPFTNSQFSIQPGDTMYIFSDGYIDQFGGENGKKFMAKKFKQLLVSIQDQPMEQQQEFLDKTIVEWRGELDQIDDILVIGLRV